MDKNKKICVVGSGKWGLNHVRTLEKLDSLGAVVDSNKKVLDSIKKNFPNCCVYRDLNNKIIRKYDGFIIATNPSSHFELAKKIIKGGKHLLVEKPLTLSYETSKILCDMAEKKQVNLMVGHVLLFHPAILKMKEIIDSGKIGNIQYLYSNRLNLGTFRTYENVFWSFAPHDIALFRYFLNQYPTKINSTGVDILQKDIHDTSITTFKYNENKMGHIFVSWLHPFKEHRFVIIGSKGMLHFEDSISGSPLLMYDSKAQFVNSVPMAREGTIIEIKYDNEKPLTSELKYFISKLDGSRIDYCSGYEGLEVVKILEEASRKIMD
mgnify:CR=1 FL=1